MAKQGHTVVAPVLALYVELPPYLHVLLLTAHVILVDVGRIDNIHTRLEEVCHIRRIYRRGNPSLTEVEVQILKRDGCRYGILQGFQRLLNLLVDLAAIGLNASFYGLDLLHHVSRNELVAYLKLPCDGIKEHFPIQFRYQVILCLVGQFRHIAQIHLTVFVERGRQGFF